MFSKKSSILFLLLCTCILAVGCQQQGNAELSASVTAEATSEGAISTRTATSEEIANLNSDIAKRRAIDARYPGSPTPWGAQSERVVDISVPGILDLANGQRIRFDGIDCDERAIGYLRRVLQAPNVTVAILPSDNNHPSLVPAEVWSVDKSLQLQQTTSSPAYSNIVEAAITSHWCTVKATPTSKHNKRYAALAEAFQDDPSAR